MRPRSLALVVLLLLPACGGEPASAPRARHVVLVTLDTLRRDAVGAYAGEHPSFTPSLDAFARDAVIFLDARAPMPFTLPSHMSMFTGVRPIVHGVSVDGRVLPRELATLPEVLHAAGFHTAGFFNNYWLKGSFGFARGFDVYGKVADKARNATYVSGVALEAAREAKERGQRSFLFVQYFDAHSDAQADTGSPLPYFSPPEYRADLPATLEDLFCLPPDKCATDFLRLADRRHIRFPPGRLEALHELYRRGVRVLDTGIGGLLAGLRELGMYDDALIILIADHGEEFREHGRLLHSQTYEESVAIPLLVKFPGNAWAGARVEGLATTTDLLPTILANVGLPIPDDVQGGDLTRLVQGEGPIRALQLSQDKQYRSRFSVTDGRYKLHFDFETRTGALYDLDADPGEQVDVKAEQPQRYQELQHGMVRLVQGDYREAEEVGEEETAPAPTLTSQERDSLRALGYLDEPGDAPEPAPHP